MKRNGKKEVKKVDGLARLREECEKLRFQKEAVLIEDALKAEKWNLNAAARAIGCAVSSLQRALVRHPEIDARRQKQAEAHGWIRRAA